MTRAPDTSQPAGDTTLPARLGRYRILRRLGGGGMGDVYLAHDPELDRPVAVKVPRVEDNENRQRFLREAQSAARVPHHAHVCPVHDTGSSGDRPYVVMAYAPGGCLADRLKAGPLPQRDGAELTRQAADGLAALHAAGVVHRDVKPANLLLDADGRVLVSDFGLAHLADAERLTSAGAVFGTPAYMPPEQAEDGATAASPAGDVWSLGVVLYHLVTGRPPFQGGAIVVLRKVLDEPVPPPSRFRLDLDPALERIVLRAMARRPEERPTAASLAAALDDWRNSAGALPNLSLPISATAPSTIGTSRSTSMRGRRRWRLSAICALVGACILFALFPTFSPHQVGVPPVELVVPVNPSLTYKGWIDARVWERAAQRRRALRLNDPGALPLRPGDLVRIEAEIEPPAYLYVVMIDTEGKASPLYPWKPGHWDARPPHEQPRGRLSLPDEPDGGWEVSAGPSGMETLLLLTRSTPLPAEVNLAALLADLPPQKEQGPQASVWFENGVVVERERTRAFSSFDPKKIDDPVLRTQTLLREKLGPLFVYTRGVSYANRGK